MERYIIISPHVPEECVKALKEILAAGYLAHFDWGCKAGDHTGWAIVEADTQNEALLAVPPLFRQKARAVQLSKFDPDDVKAMHEGH